MIVYRLSRPEFSKDLSGFGASLVGGRWNHPGEFVLYTAQTASLSILEVLVHLNGSALGIKYELITIEINTNLLTRIDQLPKSISKVDHIAECRQIGSKWLKDQVSAILEVPSVLNPLEKNFLVNPLHPDVNIKILNNNWYFFDGRLVSA